MNTRISELVEWPLVAQHSNSVRFFVSFLFEEHEVDEEKGAQEGGFHPNVQVHGEADPEVVGVGESLEAKFVYSRVRFYKLLRHNRIGIKSLRKKSIVSVS